MTTITASQFKLHLFEYLDKVEKVISRVSYDISGKTPATIE